MLRDLLRQLMGRPDARSQGPTKIPEPGTLEHFMWLRAPHADAPLELHLRTLYEGLRVGDRDFADLMQQALAQSSSSIPAIKAVRRYAATWNLVRYFGLARGVEGQWAECGVYSGASALALCLAARAHDPSFDGTGMYLVDSFEGLSPPADADAIRTPAADGRAQERAPKIPADNLRAPVEIATQAMQQFPGARIVKGWIPAAFAELPQARWAFVHLDVDLYEPTMDSLEYFEPRLSPGGVIVCDDYGALTFPGAARAWDQYFSEAAKPFVVLPTGQAVYIRA